MEDTGIRVRETAEGFEVRHYAGGHNGWLLDTVPSLDDAIRVGQDVGPTEFGFSFEFLPVNAPKTEMVFNAPITGSMTLIGSSVDEMIAACISTAKGQFENREVEILSVRVTPSIMNGFRVVTWNTDIDFKVVKAK